MALLGRATRRFDLLFNPMKLSEACGYDFHLIEHGQELIDSVGPRILPVDPYSPSSEAIPLIDLPGAKNRLVLWSRGHFKSSAVVLYIINLVLAYPDIRILLMQGTVKNTQGMLKEIKSHFDGSNSRSFLYRDFPKWCKDTRLGSANGFVSPARQRTHLKEWTVGVASPKSVKTGQHYEAGFFDDLVNDQNFRSKELLQKAIDDFKLYTPLIDPGYIKTVTGTRYSFGDLYGHIIKMDAERREWSISVKNCWKNGAEKEGVLFPQMNPEPGRTIGFTPEILNAIRNDDPEHFSYQYLNQPIMAGRQLFTQELLMSCVKGVKAEEVPALGPATLFLDLAASKTMDADNSVVLCGRQDAFSRMYACDVLSGKFSPLQLAHATLAMALKHKPRQVLIEGTAAGKYFIEYLRIIAQSKGMFIPIEEIKVSNTKDAKNLRIASIEGVLKTGKLFFLAGLPNWESLVEQFTQFPKGRHDDEIDTISLMVQVYTQTTGVWRPHNIQTLAGVITSAAPQIPKFTEPSSTPIRREGMGGFFRR